jgi:fumarylpyruvate hydrolase
VKQSTRLEMMIYDVRETIYHLSREYKLAAGDIIFTGTPAGVGPVCVGDKVVCTVTCADSGSALLPPCEFEMA